MSDSVCSVCGSPTGAGGSGGSGAETMIAAHLADFNDPHRTLDRVPRTHYGIAAPVADSAVYRPGDLYFDLASGRGYSFRLVSAPSGDDPAVYEWVCVVAPYTGSVDLSPYLRTSDAVAAFVSKEYAAAHYLTSASLDGYVTSGALSQRLSAYATLEGMASALASSGYITQSFADARYQRVASAGDSYVSSAALAAALAAYTRTADLASELSLSDYLTLSAADHETDGFVRKSAMSGYLSGLVRSSDLPAVLAGYGYVTPDYLSSGGYLTAAAGDLRYARIPVSPDAYALKSYVDAKLSEYKKATELAEYLSLSSYLRADVAAGPNGYIPKSDAGLLNYATMAWVRSELQGYIPQSGLSAVQASVQSAVLAHVDGRYATVEDLSRVSAAAGVNVLHVPELSDGAYGLMDRAANCITVTGVTDTVPVRLPPRSASGTTRDFTLTLSFAHEGVSVWAGTAVDLVVGQASGELPVRRLFSAEADVLHSDLSPYLLSDVRVVYGFFEIGDGEFSVVRKILSDLEPAVVPGNAENVESPQEE